MKKIFKNVSTVVIMLFCAKFLAFIIELLISSKMGATIETDAYYMAIGITQIIYPMISIGIWKVFMPEYKTALVVGETNHAESMTNRLIIIFSILVGILSLAILLFPKLILNIFAPGFDDYSLSISIPILRILTFMFFFNMFATFPSAILQANGQFSKSQFKEIIQHIPTLLFLILFPKNKVTGLSISVVIGALVAAVVENHYVRHYYSFHFERNIFNSEIIRILRLVPITCLNSIINQLNNIIDKVFASTLAIGSITCLNYGSKLINLFDGLFSTAISTAIFPSITEMVAKNDIKELRQFMKTYVLIMTALLIPISFIIALFSKQIVKLIFGHGEFDKNSVMVTSKILLTYGIGLLAMSLTTIINDFFYILKRTRILIITTIINIFSNIVLDYIFITKFGVVALSLATSISLFISLFVKLIYLKEYISFDKEILNNFIVVFLACLLSSYITFFVSHRFILFGEYSFILCIFIYIIVYAIVIFSCPLSFYKKLIRKVATNEK